MTLRMIDDFHAHKGLTHSVLNVFNACSTITAVTSCELSPETGADRYARFVSLINRKFIHGDACGAKRAASNKTKRREKLNLAQAFFSSKCPLRWGESAFCAALVFELRTDTCARHLMVARKSCQICNHHDSRNSIRTFVSDSCLFKRRTTASCVYRTKSM